MLMALLEYSSWWKKGNDISLKFINGRQGDRAAGSRLYPLRAVHLGKTRKRTTRPAQTWRLLVESYFSPAFSVCIEERDLLWEKLLHSSTYWFFANAFQYHENRRAVTASLLLSEYLSVYQKTVLFAFLLSAEQEEFSELFFWLSACNYYYCCC